MASEPTTLAGFMDDQVLGLGFGDAYGSIVDYLLENIPQLLHPESVRTFAKMRHEPQLSAILRVYQLALERGNSVVNGEGCRDEVTAAIADDLGLPVKGTDEAPTGARRRHFSWAKHLQMAAKLSLTFGHAPFAQQWVEQDGRWRLHMVQERMPQTITAVKLNKDDGTLAAAIQEAWTGSSGTNTITTADHRLVWYAREREGSNYYGQSLLRPSYGLWLIKDQVLRVWATSNRRNGMGVWQVEAPPGATVQQIAEAQRIASTTRASENAGLGLPAGFTARLTGMSGSLPNHKELADYLDRLMTRSTLTSIIDMATAERGNRSLGETVMDLMVYAQQAEAARIAEDATAQIVVPLVDANWGEDEPAPCIEINDVGADVQLTAEDIEWLMRHGGLRADAPARGWLRHRSGIPPEDPADPVNVAADAAPLDTTGGGA